LELLQSAATARATGPLFSGVNMTELFGIDGRANEDFTPYKWTSALEGARYTLDISSYRYMNTASKLGPHTQTDRGTCPGVGL
jgi:hypothetical protein